MLVNNRLWSFLHNCAIFSFPFMAVKLNMTINSDFVEPFAVVCPATWGSAVSSVTWSGGSFSRLRRRREETWSLQPAWWSLCPCSPLLPVSPTATGERGGGGGGGGGGDVVNDSYGTQKCNAK